MQLFFHIFINHQNNAYMIKAIIATYETVGIFLFQPQP